MTEVVQIADVGNKDAAGRYVHKPLNLTRADWMWPLAFMLSMSLTGLQFPLGIVFLAIILVNRFRIDRYDFLIMVTLMMGGYSITGNSSYYVVRSDDVALIASVFGFFVVRKTPIVKKLIAFTVLYFIVLLVFASFSDESMSIQLLTIRQYMMIVTFIVPIMVFSGRDFDMMTFFRHLVPYAIIFCAYYFVDCLILNGHVFMPNTYIGSDNVSTFFSPFMLPFSNTFPRIYPVGLYILSLCMIPVARYYKLSWWMWALIFIALGISRTFTVITGYIILYVIFIGKVKMLLKGLGFAIAALVLVYVIDASLEKDSNGESQLRIYSSVEQFVALTEATDDEDLALFASGRIAQLLPKYELMRRYDKELVGLGFLHSQKTTSAKYIIENNYYSDIEQSEEVATGVEIIPMQVILTIGYLGLLFHVLYFVMLYVAVRKLKYSIYFLSVMIAFVWFGLSGFSGLIYYHGLIMTGLALGVVILANKRDLKGFSLPERHQPTSDSISE